MLACIALLSCTVTAEPATEAADATRRTLHIVADDNYPPLLFRDVDGGVQGYLVDYWALWSRHTGVEVELEAMNWKQAQAGFQAGHADALDTIIRTGPRERLYDFSTPYADLPTNIYHHATITGVTGVETLRGFRVGVMDGDACIDKLADHGITNLARYSSYTNLIEGAVLQDIKVFCLDEMPAQFYLYRLGVQKSFRKGFTLYTGQFRRAVRKGDTTTLALVERGMAAISAEEDAALRLKWFGAPLDVASYVRTAGIAAAGMLAAGVLLLLWNVSLRRTVRRSTLELRQAFDELRKVHVAESQSRRSLAAALEAIPDLLVELDADGCYVDVFGNHEGLLESPREQLVGRRVADVLPPGASGTVVQSVEAALRSGSDYGRTIQIDLPAGLRWFELSSARKECEPGGRATVMMLSRDVTRRFETQRELEAMRAEALVAERDRVFRVLFESSPVAMLHVHGAVIESVNRQFIRLFGWDTSDLRTIDDWWRLAYPDPEYRKTRIANWEAVLAGTDHAVPSGNVTITCADGTLRQILIALQSVGDSMVVSMTDVTELMQVESALRAAKQAAEAASLAKSSFLANMSHEIRTPLNGIIGMAHLIRESGLDHDQEQRLAKLETAANHLLQILSAILDLSKIEAGKFVLEDLPLSVEAVFANTLAMIEQAAHAKGLNVVSEVPRLPCQLRGDAVRLQQALLNYAHNAVKFCDRGSITFRARVVREDPSGVLCRFEVTDTGIGVEPETLRRLFNRFEQADVTTTRRFGGTGLGLAITRGLAELMGGEAGADSMPGVGSTFWLTARLRKVAASNARPGATDRPVVEEARSRLQRRHAGQRVLVAEDNAINAEVATALLRKAGLTVDLAGDGVEAVSMATASVYALVLMDVQMPNMSGLEAARRIVAMRTEVPPIVAMTANAFPEDRAECMAAGMSDFIGKPVQPQQLYATVLKWLDQRPTAAEAV